jgi:OmpA-OmpF porin, OOP family
MTRTTRSLLIALLVAATAVPMLARAQARAGAQDRAGYVGMQVGTAKYNDFCTGITVGCDNSDTAWRFFGGYQFSRNLSLELGYANLGAASAGGGAAGDARYEANAFDFSMLIGPAISESLFLFGKLGLYRADVDLRATTGPVLGSANSKNGGITFGAGAQWNFTRSLGLRAEFQKYNNVGKEGNTREDDIDVISAGIVWKFY